jgi:hypothetical protein
LAAGIDSWISIPLCIQGCRPHSRAGVLRWNVAWGFGFAFTPGYIPPPAFAG